MTLQSHYSQFLCEIVLASLYHPPEGLNEAFLITGKTVVLCASNKQGR